MLNNKVESLDKNKLAIKATIAKYPVINFDEYDDLKVQAMIIAERVRDVQVTDENIKETKKMLARINSSLKELNDRRIAIRKEINKPYDEFAEKIKEIETIVRDADTLVRNQVREIEEQERRDKKQALEDIWNKRIPMYELASQIPFEDWLEPCHLNKTATIQKSEMEMVHFLESAERDLKVLLENGDNSVRYMTTYYQTLDLGKTLETVNRELEQERKIQEQVTEVVEDSEEIQEQYVFIIRNKKDGRLVEQLLINNEIEFKMMNWEKRL